MGDHHHHGHGGMLPLIRMSRAQGSTVTHYDMQMHAAMYGGAVPPPYPPHHHHAFLMPPQPDQYSSFESYGGGA
ncbi:hypothetical protein GUJ93_ZPchr0006g41789 [Zizania palustris]|uniref:Uncharacterized protein n=1 Tax=Zizania palustris TaxID=103762 RepID=A0A8J5VMD7_ZIZPA|nr:hypothetical protein GUJ93_ZPchr0006g41789 [Zizania palustris]